MVEWYVRGGGGGEGGLGRKCSSLYVYVRCLFCPQENNATGWSTFKNHLVQFYPVFFPVVPFCQRCTIILYNERQKTWNHFLFFMWAQIRNRVIGRSGTKPPLLIASLFETINRMKEKSSLYFFFSCALLKKTCLVYLRHEASSLFFVWFRSANVHLTKLLAP